VFFDDHYNEVVQLRNGEEVHLRLLCPRDKELLQDGFRSLSPESRYKRFFAAKLALSEAELKYLTEMDQTNHVAIGAEISTGDGHLEGLGVARFVRYTDHPDVAEVAITVRDSMQGHGLGTVLLQRLIAAAGERGVERLRFQVLNSNQPMQSLLRDVAPGATIVDRTGGVTTVEFAIPNVSPEQPEDQSHHHNSVFAFFDLAVKGTLQLQRALARLTHLGAAKKDDGPDKPDDPDIPT